MESYLNYANEGMNDRHLKFLESVPYYIELDNYLFVHGGFAWKTKFDISYQLAADFDLIARIVLRHNASWSTLGETITLFRTGGLSTRGGLLRPALSKEFARSLSQLSVPWPRARILLRYPIKAFQFIPSKDNNPG